MGPAYLFSETGRCQEVSSLLLLQAPLSTRICLPARPSLCFEALPSAALAVQILSKAQPKKLSASAFLQEG